jgi:hypothetical protein
MEEKYSAADQFFRKIAGKKPISELNMYELLGMMLTRISDQLDDINVLLQQLVESGEHVAPEQEPPAPVTAQRSWFAKLFKINTL